MAIKCSFTGFVSTLFCWARSRKHHLRELPWVPGSQLVGVLADLLSGPDKTVGREEGQKEMNKPRQLFSLYCYLVLLSKKAGDEL